MADRAQKVQVGFGGGQVISIKVDTAELGGLRKAVEAGDGWHEARTADGVVALDSREVVFVAVEDAEHRIGFGD